MTQRHEAFGPPPRRKDTDPSPDALTPEERSGIEARMDAGVNVPPRLIRKMLRQSDKQLARIIELERIAYPLVESSDTSGLRVDHREVE